MKIDIIYNNISSDGPLDLFINEKIGSLEKLIGDKSTSVRVEVGKPSKHHRSGPVFYAETNLKIGGKLLRADAIHMDLRTAIVKVKNELQQQINKFKEKRADSRKPKKAFKKII